MYHTCESSLNTAATLVFSRFFACDFFTLEIILGGCLKNLFLQNVLNQPFF